MCFNKESSLIAFIIPTLISIRLLMFKNDKLKQLFGVFGISVAIIQLFEFFIWKYYKIEKINDFFSRLLIIVTTIHPLLFFIFYKCLYNKNIEYEFIILLVIYFILSVNRIKYYLKNNNNLITKVGKSGKLLWPDKIKKYDFGVVDDMLYVLISVILLYKVYKLDNRLLIIFKYYFVIFFITMSYIYYLQSTTFDTFNGLFNTLWCFSGVSIPLITYFSI
tara:strand:- start:2398 stop:3057 length:660 start_codon:yes stop_codon:yes gene_type:complete